MIGVPAGPTEIDGLTEDGVTALGADRQGVPMVKEYRWES
jgi:hypothetical protein